MDKEDKKIHEQDMYIPIRNHFSSLGYTVNSEVMNCDVTAFKDNEIIVVEMKKSINMKLIMQAVNRQKYADEVYVALYHPGRSIFSARWKNICYLLKRLELGLILVSVRNSGASVRVEFHPAQVDMKKVKSGNLKRRRKLVDEITTRHGDFNIGGSTNTKLVTSYREKAIHIACCLIKEGELTPKKLREMGTDRLKTSDILQDNHYGWFERVKRGVYRISETGQKELNKYDELVKYYYDK